MTSFDLDALVEAVPDVATLRLETAPGRYAVRGMVVARLEPPRSDEECEQLEEAVNAAVGVGATRSSRQDPGFPVRQLVDVALRALSPGIHDPTTALDAMFHLATVLVAHLERDPFPTCLVADRGRRLELPHVATDRDLIDEAVTELRTSAGDNPVIYLYLLEMLHVVQEAVGGDVDPARLGSLREQAALVVSSAERAAIVPVDLDSIRASYRERFGADR